MDTPLAGALAFEVFEEAALPFTRAGFGGPKVVCAALELQNFFGGRKLVSGDVRFLPYFVRFTSSFGHRLEVALTVTFDPKRTLRRQWNIRNVSSTRTTRCGPREGSLLL